MKYKAIIFDFDDTLVESRLQKWAQHKHVAKKFYNIDLQDEEIRQHWGKPFHELISILYQNSDTIENMDITVTSVKNDFMKKPYEGSLEIVNHIIDKGIQIGILSAANTNHIKADLEHFNFPLNQFFAIQGADQTNVHKPNPQVFNPIFEKLTEKGLSLNEILYVGDSIDDYQAAKDAGIDFVGIATGLYSEEDFQNKGVNIVLSKINELPNFL